MCHTERENIEKTEENIMEFTTMERLQMKVSASYGAVIQFGDKVFVTDCHWKGGFTAEIYEFVETPDETALGDIECRLAPWGKTDEGSQTTATQLPGAWHR